MGTVGMIFTVPFVPWQNIFKRGWVAQSFLSPKKVKMAGQRGKRTRWTKATKRTCKKWQKRHSIIKFNQPYYLLAESPSYGRRSGRLITFKQHIAVVVTSLNPFHPRLLHHITDHYKKLTKYSPKISYYNFECCASRIEYNNSSIMQYIIIW